MPEDLLQAEAPPAASPMPADVPEKFWDAATGTLRTEALVKSYRELERRLSQRIAPPGADTAAEEVVRFRQAMGIPETPDAYSIEPPHELCCADAEVNAALHDAHFSNAQAQLVYDLAARKLLPLIAEAAATYEAEHQREKLTAHFGGPEAYRAVAGQLAAWGRAKLPPGVFSALSTTAEGVLALHQMMQGAEPAMPRDTAAPSAESEAELRSLMRDPRYWRAREPEFVRRVTDGFRRLVGG